MSVELVICPDCRGQGYYEVPSVAEVAEVAYRCSRCEGTGSIPKENTDGA